MPVEFLVDQTRPRPLQLMAHSSGTPNLYGEIFVERINRAANALANLETPLTRRRRILDDIHRERNYPARPVLRLAEHLRERHGQTMIDVHPIDDGQVEILLNDRLRDV